MKRFIPLIVSIVAFIFPLLPKAEAQTQSVLTGTTTAAVNFPGTGCVYSWVNDTPGIGLAANGTGDIPAFTAVNNGSSTITATIIATSVPGGVAYIANEGDNTVSVINTTTNKVTATIPVGTFPQGVAISPDGATAYITNTNDNTVSVLNTVSNKVIATIPVGSSPFGVTVSPDGSLVYVANFGGNSLSVISTASNMVLSTIPTGLGPYGVAVSPDGSTVYATNGLFGVSNTVSVINTSTKAMSTITVGFGVAGISLTPDGSKLYVANQNDNTVSVINTSNNTVTATITVGGDPEALSISPDGSTVYVANFNSNSISVINTVTDVVTATIPAGTQPQGVSVSPDGSEVYVTDAGSGNVSVINTATKALTTTIGVGSGPTSFGNFTTAGTNCGPTPVKFTITVNPASASTPTITVGSPTGTISACVGSASASPNIQQVTVSGSNLTGNITVAAPANFEVSLSAGSGYGSNVTLVQTGGIVNNTTVYVRSAATAPSGNISGNLTLTSAGAVNQSAAVTGTVNALPVVNPVSVQVYPNGTLTSGVVISATPGATINWVNNTPAIGLAASGTGNIAPFIAVNTGNSQIVATITATAVSATGCSSLPVSFSIKVNPPPTITPGAVTGAISACAGAASASPFIEQFTVSGISLTGNVTATAPNGFQVSLAPGSGYGTSLTIPQSGGNINNTTVYVRSAVSGTTGNVSGNVVLNSTGAATRQVNVSGIIYALPSVNAVANQTKINGATTTAINFSGSGNNVYTWVNNAPGIGLAASGTGNIAPFTTVNTGTTPVVATVTVTPVPVGYGYIANYTSGTVSVINTATNTTTATVTVGSGPIGVSVSPDGSRVYVTNETSNDVSVINTGTNTVVSTIPVGSTPYGIVVSPDGTLLYVTNYYSSSVSVISTATTALVATIPVGTTPNGITVSPDGTRLYVTNYYSDDVSVISTASNTVIATIFVGSLPNGAAISPDGTRLYVSNQNSNDVSVINTLTDAVIATIPVGSVPAGIAVSPDGLTVYVANESSNTVSVISTATNAVTSSINVGSGPDGVSVSPDGSEVYVTNLSSNSVSIINTATGIVSATVNVGGEPLSQGNFITVGKGCTGVSQTFTITVNPILIPAITTAGTLPPLTTTYGTASASAIFNVSGVNLTAGILVTPPAGFEVSTDNITFTSTVTIGAPGTVASTPVYIRLPSTMAAGSYAGNIVLSSTGATDQNVAATGIVNPAVLTITANSISKTYGSAVTGAAVSTAFVSTSLQNGETIGSVTITYGKGAAISDPAGTYTASVTASSATGGTFTASNYTITYVSADIVVNPASLTITVDDQNKVYGQPNPVFTLTYYGFVNSESSTQLTVQPTVTTTATTASLPGQYPIIASSASSPNYTIIYIPGILTINATTQSIIIPNAFTPNGDGFNDTWNIKNLDTYPNCTVQVYTRYGENVYTSLGYGTAWDGTYKGAALPTSTYYYVINLKNGDKPFSGFVAIIR